MTSFASVSAVPPSINLGSSDQLNLTGTGDTIYASQDVIALGANSSGTVDGSGDTIVFDGTGSSVTANHDKLEFASGVTETIYGSDDTIYASPGSHITVDGNHDTIDGASGDTIDINGQDDTWDDPGGTVYDNGGEVVDDGGYGGYYGYDFVRGSQGKIAQDIAAISMNDGASQAEAGKKAGLESAAASAAGTSTPQTELEGARWSGKTITWSVGGGQQFSSSLDAREQATVEQAIEAWAKASGLTFTEVPDSAQADIRIGFGRLSTDDTGVLGVTNYRSEDGQLLSGVTVRMEDPGQKALVSGANGQLVYAGTEADLYQVALHEIGHALGLGDSADPNSVMYYGSNASNRQLDATDLAEIRALYDGSLPAGGSAADVSSRSVNQLIHAMAAYGANAGGAASSSSLGYTQPYNELTLTAYDHSLGGRRSV